MPQPDRGGHPRHSAGGRFLSTKKSSLSLVSSDLGGSGTPREPGTCAPSTQHQHLDLGKALSLRSGWAGSNKTLSGVHHQPFEFSTRQHRSLRSHSQITVHPPQPNHRLGTPSIASLPSTSELDTRIFASFFSSLNRSPRAARFASSTFFTSTRIINDGRWKGQVVWRQELRRQDLCLGGPQEAAEPLCSCWSSGMPISLLLAFFFVLGFFSRRFARTHLRYRHPGNFAIQFGPQAQQRVNLPQDIPVFAPSRHPSTATTHREQQVFSELLRIDCDRHLARFLAKPRTQCALDDPNDDCCHVPALFTAVATCHSLIADAHFHSSPAVVSSVS